MSQENSEEPLRSAVAPAAPAAPAAPEEKTDTTQAEGEAVTTSKVGTETATTVEGNEKEEEEEEEEEPEDGVPIVLVSRASGFIAMHIIKQLLEQGRYHVRGTVRNKKREDKVKPLFELVPEAEYPLRLVEADLCKPESWAKAVNRCTYVLHVASPAPVNVTDEAELIHTAVEGTINVLKASADAGTVKRVVVTSSVAAVSSGFVGNPDKDDDYVYTEKDWSVETACGPYEKSKLRAEQAAWDFVKELDESKRFELVVLNPSYVHGPLLSASCGEGSKEACERLLANKIPAIPDMSFVVVDVRDVAAAHIAAVEKSEAAGNRYILANKGVHLMEYAQLIGNEFRPQGYKIPSRNMPKPLVWVGKIFIPSLKHVYAALGKRLQYNNERMINDLGVQPRPVEESIIDLCYSLVEVGLVKKTPGYLGHPSTRPPPVAPKEEITATGNGRKVQDDSSAQAAANEEIEEIIEAGRQT